MSITITERKEHLVAELHGSTLNRIRNIEALFQRSANTLLSKIDPIDTMRLAALTNTIHDDIYNYPLPTDFKKIIDLYPQSSRTTHDTANRRLSEKFDLGKELHNKTISIEGSEGSKILRVNWRTRQAKTINEANTLTANGTWSALGGATGLIADDIDYVSGTGSIKFNVAATGDGIFNNNMTAVDLTDEDEVADFFVWVKIKNSTDLANLNSITGFWGNDETTNYWYSVAQTTQADGTAFKVGWNQIKFPWSTATETGTVNPATIDTFMINFNVDAAISGIRVDNITCSIGKNFDIKYYSKYLLKNAAGTWIDRTTSDDDVVVLDSDAINILLLEDLIAGAQQAEGSDSNFDINYAKVELEALYNQYKKEYPSQAKKPITYYGNPHPGRGRW